MPNYFQISLVVLEKIKLPISYIYFEFGPEVQEMSFKDISDLELYGPFVSRAEPFVQFL